MKRAIAGLAMAAGLLGAGSAQAEPYVMISLADDIAVFLNSGRTREIGGNRLVWLTMVQRHAKTGPDGAFDYTLEQWELDCRTDRFARRKVVAYDLAGNLRGDIDLPGTWISAIPGSMGDGVMQGVCNPEPDEEAVDLEIAELVESARAAWKVVEGE